MTTYEFNEYMRLLNDQVKSDREREMQLAGISRLSNMMNI